MSRCYHRGSARTIWRVSTWRIDSWSSADRCGLVKGRHLGPFPFGEAETKVYDYAVGEEVIVELVEESRGRWRVTKVIPKLARQPEGTHLPDLEKAIGLPDFGIRSYDGRTRVLEIVGGMDLDYPRVEIRFHEVELISCPTRFSDPLFRLASSDERRVFEGLEGKVFCIVTEHGDGPDGPRHFVVAARAECRAIGR
jgi:hypothetical protein